jgi:uncharacterized protein (DUF2267 family)
MKYHEFLQAVEQETGIDDREEAERTAVTVLQALCDRLTGEEANDLLSQLPEPLKHEVAVSPSPAKIDANQFVSRTAHELEISPDEARARVRGVFAVIQRAVTPGEFHDVLVQLPSGYAELVFA